MRRMMVGKGRRTFMFLQGSLRYHMVRHYSMVQVGVAQVGVAHVGVVVSLEEEPSKAEKQKQRRAAQRVLKGSLLQELRGRLNCLSP